MSSTWAQHLQEPYRDPSGLGFAIYPEKREGFPLRRQTTVVGVCWNFAEDRAYFFNGAGFVVPSWHNRDALAALLRRRTVRQEFGRVIGEGQFSIKQAELNAMQSTGRIKPWIVHWLAEQVAWLDDVDAWAAYVEADQEAERRAFAQSYEAAADLRARGLNVAEAGDSRYELALRNQLDESRAELESARAEALAADARITAWLRGVASEPPLLAMMQAAV